MIQEIKRDLLIKCACHSEVLSVAQDEDFPIVYLAIYSSYGVAEYNKSWKYFFRLIWNWMRTGRLYDDQIVLEKDQIIELRNYLNQIDLGETNG